MTVSDLQAVVNLFVTEPVKNEYTWVSYAQMASLGCLFLLLLLSLVMGSLRMGKKISRLTYLRYGYLGVPDPEAEDLPEDAFKRIPETRISLLIIFGCASAIFCLLVPFLLYAEHESQMDTYKNNVKAIVTKHLDEYEGAYTVSDVPVKYFLTESPDSFWSFDGASKCVVVLDEVLPQWVDSKVITSPYRCNYNYSSDIKFSGTWVTGLSSFGIQDGWFKQSYSE